jgi:Ser/Thr protein kinase RdoA (MazF antagonist)
MIDLQAILPDIKNVLIREYWIFIERPTILWENENLVIHTKWKVIRITSEDHRNQKELEAELEFIQELKSQWCAVPEVILTNTTAETYKLVNSVNGKIYLVVFVELKWVWNIHSEEW